MGSGIKPEVRKIGLSGFGYGLQFPCHTCGEAVRQDFTKEGNVREGLKKGPIILTCGSCKTAHKAELDKGRVKVTKL